ncbi:gamma-glutamyl hydrolase-like isoform X2 [Paramacrobiotus metropolitanus]|uniref:gamma-glutamyl hydrolase-like isoform X2 n=1 Tax=Paramacrobiotus metropolitanus TaxID=2943436 RepID=UPI0024461A88|nr:gamma-glutamyl hydrolase-like isoform X2 [Paramacrobiotus metropolitanus]
MTMVGMINQLLDINAKKLRSIYGTYTTSTRTTPSFIAASYVKWIESAGARVVPVLLSQPPEYYTALMSKINGVLFPGGGVSLTDSGYAQTGKLLYAMAKEMNDKGNYFPIWGTCLGYELLTVLTADGCFLTSCNAENVSLPLQFPSGYKLSRMFSPASKEVTDILANESSTANSHRKCLTPASFSASGLKDKLRPTSYSTAQDGVTFIAAVEDLQYPFYGVQFHPEKAHFEFHHPSAYSHSQHAILASQYFANFFVSQTRMNKQRFQNQEEEDKYSIYNWNPMFSKATIYDQMYLF